MILQLLNQYVYKLEYIILGTIKDTPIKISIDDTFYDIRQKINNPDLVKIHKEDLKKYDFDMKYGRNNVLKDIIHSMYKNSYNCDIFLGIGGNDKKAHKYRTSNNRQVIVVDKVIALRFGQRDEKQFRSASQLDIVEIVINTEHLEDLGDTYRIKFIDSDEKSLYDFALEIGLLITEQSDASLLDGALVSKEANYIKMNIMHGDIDYNLDDSEFETGKVYQESLREISKNYIEHINKASYFLSEATLIINDTPIKLSAEEGWIIDIHIHESKSNDTPKIPRELLEEIDKIQSLSEFKQPITLINNSLSLIHDNSIFLDTMALRRYSR